MTLNRLISTLLLLAILLLAAYLRFANLTENPGWYTDEGTHLEIAKHLVEGHTQYLAINRSHLLFSRLPLFGRLLAAVAYFRGLDILALRGLTATLGVLSVWLTYFVAKSLINSRWVALAAAVSLAIYPDAVLYSRFGFSYNLLAPFLLISLWGISEGCKRADPVLSTETKSSRPPSPLQFSHLMPTHWGIGLAAVSIGLGMITDLAMICLIPWLLWFAFKRHWRDGFWAMALAGFPLALFALFSMINDWDAFWFDLAFVRSRLGGRSLVFQLWLIGKNFTLLLNQSSWFALGFVGLWLIPAKAQRNLVLLALASPLIILGRTVPLTELSFYYIVWALPILAIGLGSLLCFGHAYMVQLFENRAAGLLVATAIFALPLTISTAFTIQRVHTNFGTSIDRFLLNAYDATAATGFVNSQIDKEDVIIASPSLAWRIDGQVADFQMALAAEGVVTPHLPADLPAERFAFDPRFSNADYVIVDNLWRNWAMFHIPQLNRRVEELEKWPVIFESGEITVYQNRNKN